MENFIVCPVCHVKKYNIESSEDSDLIFEFSYLNKRVCGSEVYTKVCRHVPKNNESNSINKCINSCKNYNEDLNYKYKL